MKIGIMVALQKEWEFFGNCLQNFSAQTIGGCRFGCGSWKNHKITAVVSGMGKVNAAICATRLICDFKPDIIINIGISGGLDNSLDIGDFVVGDDIVYHDVWCGKPNMMGQVQDFPLFYHSDTTLAAKLKDLRHGLLCCGDQFISEADELQKIKHIFQLLLPKFHL